MKRKSVHEGGQPESEPTDPTFDSLIRNVAHVSLTGWQLTLPAVGSVIGEKYRLTALLGRGGMGAVFSAVHVVTDKPVAVKWLLSATSDERTRRRFLREARAAARVSHPNVIDVYDVGEDGAYGYLVMELLRGETLRERLQRGPLAASEAIDLLLPALRGVAAMHRAGVVHRDMKPDNIFLCESDEPAGPHAKVLDFGISAMTSFDPRDPTQSRDGLSGTPAYMAPESFEAGYAADNRTDVYSMGVILYEMLTRRLPFEADTLAGLLLAITRDTPRAPSAIEPRLPPGLDRVVLRALAKQPSERFASVEELSSALLPFTSPRRGQAPGPLPLPAATSRWKVALACAALSCTASLALWLGWTRSAPRSAANPPAIERSAVSPNAASSADAAFGAQPPYLAGRECSTCLASQCVEESANCQADAACASLLAAARASTHPLVADRDYVRQLFDARWALDHGQASWLVLRDRLITCARDHCRDACSIGRNFGCVGQFDWPASYPASVQLHLRLMPQDDPSLRFAGWRVRACARGRSCEQLVGSGRTDATGFASLNLDLSRNAPNARRLPEFDGELELDGGPDFYPQILRQSAPFLDHWYKRNLISSQNQLRQHHEPRGLRVPDETHGLLQVQVQDCNFWMAWGLTLEIWKYTRSGYQPCADCPVMYPDDLGLPDANLKEFQGLSMSAAEAALPAGDVMLVARETRTRRPISVLTHVDVRVGHENSVVLFPASREQLAALPSP